MTASEQAALDLPLLATGPKKDDDELSAVDSQMDTATERAYGTFEVSLIDVDSDGETQPLQPHAFDLDEAQDRHSCVGDCCSLVTFLWLPVRVHTYKTLAFHVVTLIMAAAASVWTMLILLLRSLYPGGTVLQSCESATFHALLRVEAALCNFISPRSERFAVYLPTSGLHPGASEFSNYVKTYFSMAKLVCSAIPGAVSGLAFVMSLKNLVFVIVSDEASLPVEHDVVILLAVAMVYAAALLMKAFVVISRHMTFFFCVDHFLQTA